LGLPTALLALDLSVLYFALPRLSADLGATATQQLWITDIYGFVTAGFLVTMGTLGDRIGRRKLLLIGAACFGVASVLAAYSTTAAMLIGTRALMGVAGATLMPSTLGLITDIFQDSGERATAIAAWTGCFMVGAAAGPIAGGALLAHFWWGSAFLIGVPVMIVLLIAGPFLLPEYRAASAAHIDTASVALSLAALLPIIFGIKRIAVGAGAVVPLTAIAVGVICGIAFARRQRTLAHPLLDLQLFRNRPFSAALLILMFSIAMQGGVMLLVTQYLLIGEDLSPLRAGRSLIPASIAMVIGCVVTPVVARRIRPAWIIIAGLLISAGGYLVLAGVHGARGHGVIAASAILIFVGIAPIAVLSQHLIVGSVPSGQIGSAAAISETSGDLGIALGVAIFGSIGNAVHNRQMLSNSADSLAAGIRAAAAISALSSVALVLAAAALLSIPPNGSAAPEQLLTDGPAAE
jgi:DHA2 family multidrug resistance protein-like MFS transporter